MISKYENIPLEKTLGTIVAERAIDVLCILIIIFIGLIVEFERISEKLLFLIQGKNFTTILLIFGVILLLFILIFQIVKKTSLNAPISKFFNGLLEGLIVIFKMEKRFYFILHTIFIWLMYVLMFWVTSKAFIELYDASFFQLMISFASE